MELRVGIFWAATGRWMCKTWWHRHESQLYRASNVPYDQKVPKKPRYLKILKSINFVSKKEYKVILRVWGQGMWLHESESNSIITEAYENKIFLTIIYISNNSQIKNMILCRLLERVKSIKSSKPSQISPNLALNKQSVKPKMYRFLQ